MAKIFKINTIRFRDFVRQIRQQRNVNRAQSAFTPLRLRPSQMRELRIHGAGDYLSTKRFKLRNPVRERDNLRRADEGKIQRIEKENNILPLVILQRNLLHLLPNHSRAFEIRRRLADQRLRPMQRVLGARRLRINIVREFIAFLRDADREGQREEKQCIQANGEGGGAFSSN